MHLGNVGLSDVCFLLHSAAGSADSGVRPCARDGGHRGGTLERMRVCMCVHVGGYSVLRHSPLPGSSDP